MIKYLCLFFSAMSCLVVAYAEEDSPFHFDAGADLRVREEIFHNVPYLTEGGMTYSPVMSRSKTRNHFRIRPRVWAELKMGDHWRVYARMLDEFRAGIAQSAHANTWPGEVVIDNLFLEGNNLFDGRLDLRVGRSEMAGLYGLDHIFMDGTPGDGSRTSYANMMSLALHMTEDSWLDVFALLCQDRDRLRFGTRRSYRAIQLTGFGGNDTEMDDWAVGAIWNSRIDLLSYQLFAMQKNTASFHRAGVKHPSRHVNLVGMKLVPHWTEAFSTPLELMGQVGENGRDESLRAWAAYAGFDWREKVTETQSLFVNGGLLALSGDKDTGSEDGGRHAWDPMWYRSICDSEMLAYGGLYGVCWWSNIYVLKATTGYEFSKRHKVQLMAGPMFAQEKDGLGGGDGQYKGFLSQARYDFPLFQEGRFEMFGHVLLEWFNPGDYYETDRPAYFVRWQIDFKF